MMKITASAGHFTPECAFTWYGLRLEEELNGPRAWLLASGRDERSPRAGLVKA